jgi:hypothetical protein
VPLPMVVMLPGGKAERLASEPAKLVIGIAQQGKAGFLKHRNTELAALLGRGIAVCLPDVRAAGETDPGGDGGRHNRTVDTSATDLMLGQTALGTRLRDLRTILRYLRSRDDLKSARIGLWGDSFAPVNDPQFRDPPIDADDPHEAQPLGGLLALLAGLFEGDVRAILIRRGLLSFDCILDLPFVYVPHDIIVPGVLAVGDLSDIAAALAPRPLRFESPVGGRNCPVGQAEMRWMMQPALAAYSATADRLVLSTEISADAPVFFAAI